jgi:hypothetical protein
MQLITQIEAGESFFQSTEIEQESAATLRRLCIVQIKLKRVASSRERIAARRRDAVTGLPSAAASE